ncbi:MAG: AI-2E family transporter, partial [bacterium]
MSDTGDMRSAVHQAGPILVGALLLVGLYLAVREAVGPFMLLLALSALLYPYRTEGWARGFLGTGLLFFALWFIYRTQTVLTPVVLGLLAAYLLDPFIDRLERRDIPRTLGILALLTAAVVAVGLALLVIVPVLVDQISTLSSNLPGYVARTREWISAAALPFLERMGFEVRPDFLSEAIFGEGQQAGATVQRILGGALEVTSGVYAVLAQLLNILLIPIITFYLLKDYDAMAGWAMGLVPPRR